MENLSLVSSSKPVTGLFHNRKPSIFYDSFLGSSRKLDVTSKPRKYSASSSLLVLASRQSHNFERPRRDQFASIFSSCGQQTSSVGVNPPIPVQSTPSSAGSPLFWIGVGSVSSALFSWAANYLKKYAMQQAGNMNTQIDLSNIAAFTKSDVVPEETIQKSAFEKNEPSDTSPLNYTPTVESSTLLSMDALERMMDDRTTQNMLYPYLPEKLRNPTAIKLILENPIFRRELLDIVNKMGGITESKWDIKMIDRLKNFDPNSSEVKKQFDQLGLSTDEVLSKIMANPDVAMAFQNPRVQAAIMDCVQNQMSISKYQGNQEVMDVFNKISELFPVACGGFS